MVIDNGHRNFESRSSDNDDTRAGIPSPNFHTNGRTGAATDLTCIGALYMMGLHPHKARTHDTPVTRP
ncbi:hypothetical protein TNCV_4582681 [Trichonephila clavipes]|nr:hypothetical protein TNCV_4582681 [Trichonephila clavipes]